MRTIIIGICAAGLLNGAAPGAATARTLASPIVIDHACTNLAAIPSDAILTARNECKWHYGRQSHGRQITVGLDIIKTADPFYSAIWKGDELPIEPDALCIYTDGVYPDDYWRSTGIDITRAILDANPALNISAFCWCTELNSASEVYVQGYLEAMQILESEYPDVAFVYFTGTAEYDGGAGYNRALRNEQIRNFCLANNKVLYDFEDLDSWWFNPDTQEWEQATYLYNNRVVPVEHPMLAGSDAEHTSFESCEQKGRAAWWMMAKLSGWSSTAGVEDDESDEPVPGRPPYEGFDLSCHPNPCNPTATITFSLAASGHANLAIYDAQGRLVRTLVDGSLAGGSHSIIWNGTNESGARVASGVYFSRIAADKKTAARKILLLR